MDKQSISVLNSLLSAELLIVKTYTKILERIPHSSIGMELNELKTTHARTVDRLRRRLQKFDGGTENAPSAFAIPPLTTVTCEATALSLLAQTESHALTAYEAHIDDLDSNARAFVLRELLPNQEAAESVVSTLNSVSELAVRTA